MHTKDVRRSPLVSPLVGDPVALNALALDPGSPRLSADAVHAYARFTLEQQKQQQRRERSATIEALKTFSFELEVSFVLSVVMKHVVNSIIATKHPVAPKASLYYAEI